jgi:hypothetical protein
MRCIAYDEAVNKPSEKARERPCRNPGRTAFERSPRGGAEETG